MSLWRALPRGECKTVFQKHLLKGIWKFAAGMSGIAVLSIILTQLDKIILSRMLSLEIFGYYMLASMVAMSLIRLFQPVFYSIYPRLTQLVSVNDEDGLKCLYHKCCQFMSVLILPVAAVIAIFSYEIMLIWTQNPVTAGKTHLIVSILICGTAVNGLMCLPYSLQLAFGWTSLSVYKNMIAVIVFVPLIIYMTAHYGAIGAACTWLTLHLGFFFFEIPIMHARLLHKEKWRWYLQDVFLPLVSIVAIAGLWRLFIGRQASQLMMLAGIVSILLLTFCVAAIVTPTTRIWLFGQAYKIRKIVSIRSI